MDLVQKACFFFSHCIIRETRISQPHSPFPVHKARQPSLPFVVLSLLDHLISCHQSRPAARRFSVSQRKRPRRKLSSNPNDQPPFRTSSSLADKICIIASAFLCCSQAGPSFSICAAKWLFADLIFANCSSVSSFENPGMYSSISESVGACLLLDCMFGLVGEGRFFE